MEVLKTKKKLYKQFLRDRHLVALDFSRLRAFCEKYGVEYPEDEVVAVVGWHKMRIECKGIPAEEREKSAEWLAEHGMKVGIR